MPVVSIYINRAILESLLRATTLYAAIVLRFKNSIDGSAEEKANPWLLLNREFPDGAIPVIADANSLTYVLHLGLGDDFILNQPAGPVKLRVVASLADSVFQSELLMADRNFLRLFPEQEGYRFFLIDTPAPEQVDCRCRISRAESFGFWF